MDNITWQRGDTKFLFKRCTRVESGDAMLLTCGMRSAHINKRNNCTRDRKKTLYSLCTRCVVIKGYKRVLMYYVLCMYYAVISLQSNTDTITPLHSLRATNTKCLSISAYLC